MQSTSFAQRLVVIVLALTGVAIAQSGERVERERTREQLPPAAPEAPLVTDEPLVVVHFARGSARLDEPDRRALAPAVRWMKQHPQRLLIIEGHTDRAGDRRSNMRLSQERADVVRAELTRLGVDPVRMVPTGYGEMEPAADAARSRRVVLRGTLQTYEDLISEQLPDARLDGALDPPEPPRDVTNDRPLR